MVPGSIKEFDRVTGWHLVAYDDGDQRREPLNHQHLCWRWEEDSHAEDLQRRRLAQGPGATVPHLDEPHQPEPSEPPQPPQPPVREGDPAICVEAMSDSEAGDEESVAEAVEVEPSRAEASLLPYEEDPLDEQCVEVEVECEEVADVYKVERVLAEREGKFLVRWEGWPPSQLTWEPSESFLDPSPITIFRRARAAWIGRHAQAAANVSSGDTTEQSGADQWRHRSDGLYECEGCWRVFEKLHGLLIHRGKHCAGPGSAASDPSVRPPPVGRTAEPASTKYPPPMQREDGMYECEGCGRSFETVHGMNIHRARCNGELERKFAAPPARREDGMYECEGCGRSFETVHGLNIHRARCNGEPERKFAAPPARREDGMYECEGCGRSFETVHGLNIHRARCNGEQEPMRTTARADGPYECEECGRDFDSLHGRQIHRARHCEVIHGARPAKEVTAAIKPPPPLPREDGMYECEDCKRAFDSVHGRQIHRARHCEVIHGARPAKEGNGLHQAATSAAT